MTKLRPLIAKDCMPFYLNGEECAGNAIGESESSKITEQELCLKTFPGSDGGDRNDGTTGLGCDLK